MTNLQKALIITGLTLASWALFALALLGMMFLWDKYGYIVEKIING